MLKSSLCDYSNAYIVVKGTTLINRGRRGATAAAIRTDERGKEVVFKNCAPFTDFINKINNTQEDNAKNLEYYGNYSKTCGGLQQYFRDVPDGAVNAAITDSK